MLAKTSSKIFTIVFLLFLANNSAIAGKLEIHDAWAHEAPPNAAVMAAYLTLHNHSTKTFTLVSASSPDFKRVEMHRTEQDDGMTKMLPVSRVMLSTNGSVSFQPGGMHLMLMKPKKRFKAGDSISLTLFFTDESSLKISVPIKKSTGHAKQHGDHHSSHDSLHKSSHDMHDKKNNQNHSHSHNH